MSRRVSRKEMTSNRALVEVKYECDNEDCADFFNVSMTKKAAKQSEKFDMGSFPCLKCSTGTMRKAK